MGIIYRAYNSINGKSYIGQTTNSLEHRKRQHYYESKSRPYLFHKALIKYDKNIWEWVVIEEVQDDKMLDSLEMYYISKYRTYIGFQNNWGYNSTLGGSNLMLLPEHRKKVIESISGDNSHWKKKTPEERERFINTYLRKPRTEEQVFNMSKGMLGKNAGKSNGMYGKLGKSNPTSKTIIIIFPSGKEVKVKGIAHFARIYNLSVGNICKVLCGKFLHTKGFTAREVSENDDKLEYWDESEFENYTKDTKRYKSSDLLVYFFESKKTGIITNVNKFSVELGINRKKLTDIGKGIITEIKHELCIIKKAKKEDYALFEILDTYYISDKQYSKLAKHELLLLTTLNNDKFLVRGKNLGSFCKQFGLKKDEVIKIYKSGVHEEHNCLKIEKYNQPIHGNMKEWE